MSAYTTRWAVTAEIIFGAVHDPAMQGQLRVTAIATGFEHAGEPALGEA